MKKLGLFIAAIAFGMGSSFGQQLSIPQTPAQNDVSTITQVGDKNKADVDQLGTYNNSKIYQETSDNKAFVDQINTVGFLIPTNSDIRQTGMGNLAVVDQNSVLEIASFSPLSIKFSLPLNANITQRGDYNKAIQKQNKFSNTATILQTGGLNEALQEQDVEMTDDYIGSYNTASINQGGWENTAKQFQNGLLNSATIEQPGNENTAIQVQALYSVSNNAGIIQSGNSNFAGQNQIGMLNSATIYQTSDKNVATQNQLSLIGITIDSDSPDLSVALVANKATILQEEGECNVATQLQANTVVLLNEAIALQSGDKNNVFQTQAGGANYSIVQQDGCGLNACVKQISIPIVF